MASKLIASPFLFSFPFFSAKINSSSQNYNLENFALSICLAKGFTDPEVKKEVFAATGAYVELGSYPAQAYEETDKLAKQFLARHYPGKKGDASLTVMKGIDLAKSDELKMIKDKYAR